VRRGDRIVIVRSGWQALVGSHGTIRKVDRSTSPAYAFVSVDRCKGKSYHLRVRDLRVLDPTEALGALED